MTSVILSENAQKSSFDYFEANELALFPINYGLKEEPRWKKLGWTDSDPYPIVWHFSSEWSKDRAKWERWRREYPNCNFGIIAGPSQCIPLDLDVSKDPEIWKKYCKFWQDRGLTPPSPQFKSARNGWHSLVRVPDGFDLSTLKQTTLMPNVDTRVGNGYIIAPGSYYDGTKKGEAYGWYQMVADAAALRYDPAIFQVLVEVLGRNAKTKTKGKSSAPGATADADLSLIPPLDEVVARIQTAYGVGPVRREGDRWIRDPATHANNPDPADRARREANGYFADYPHWMPVGGAVHALSGESAKGPVAP